MKGAYARRASLKALRRRCTVAANALPRLHPMPCTPPRTRSKVPPTIFASTIPARWWKTSRESCAAIRVRPWPQPLWWASLPGAPCGMAAEEDAMTVPIRQTTSNGRTMSEVLQDIVANIQEIVHSEFRLAKVEIHEETTKAVRSSIPPVIGVLLSLYALGFILLAVVHALSMVVDAWLATLIVGAGVLVISMILVSVGRNRFKKVKVVPEKTVVTVKENVQWAKHQIR